MIGKIKKVKDELGNYFFPLTSSKAVVMEDGSTRLDDKLVDQEERIANWETFKANGGEIGGNVSLGDNTSGALAYLESKRNINSELIGTRLSTASGGKSAITHTTNDVTDFVLYMDKDSVMPNTKGETELGTSTNAFKDLYLSGISKSANGYTKLPNGMIMQWGHHDSTTINNNVDVARSFPITFPTSCTRVVYSTHFQDDNGNVGIGGSRLYHFNTRELQFRHYALQSARPVTVCKVTWFAIGY